jgi:uncharacterized protein YjbI with pentapeptide repeats
MANPEHLKILEQGIEAWNQWREVNPTIKPNLRKAKLEARNLRGVNFRDTDLQRAKLSNADLGRLDNRDSTYLGSFQRAAVVLP